MIKPSRILDLFLSTFVLLCFGAAAVVVAHCETPKPKDAAVKEISQPSVSKLAPIPPVIPPELEIRYLRTALESQTAARAADQAAEREKDVRKEVIDACGSGFTPKEQTRPDGKSVGRLVCAPIPTTTGMVK